MVIAAAGNVKRELWGSIPEGLQLANGFSQPHIAMPGVLVLQAGAYLNAEKTAAEIAQLNMALIDQDLAGLPLIVLADDASFTAANIDNLVWVTFTRSNPAVDIYGINDFTENKHWGCKGSLIIDARKKPHHAPELIKDAEVEAKIDEMSREGRELFGVV
ncbi:4-hydroxybenzoate decarboxylase subunit C [compost metagenome]